MRLRKRLKIKFLNKITIVILLVLLLSFILLHVVKHSILKVLYSYAKSELTNVSTYVITNAVNSINSEEYKLSDLLEMVYNKNEEIISVDFNMVKVNKYLVEINDNILGRFKEIERGDFTYLDSKIFKKEKNNKGFIYFIPLAVSTENIIISNLGPKIPIKIVLNGSVTSNLKTDLTSYGINSSLLKIYIDVKTSINVTMPFVSENIVIEEEIPIIMKIINGSIPEVYGGAFSVTSPINSD